MPTYTTEKFLSCLCASNVVPPDQVEQILAQVQTDDAKVLAVEFIRRKLLTEWQAKSLLTGRKQLTLGNYQLLERLKKNEHGDRFLAFHTQLDRTVEIQILPLELKDDQQSLEQFIQKVNRASTIDHPNLVHVYDLDQERGRYYLVEEHVEGTPLVDCIDRLSMLQIVKIIRQALGGLLNAHQNQVVHGHVSLSDLLINNEDQLKISNLALSSQSTETVDDFSLFDLHAIAAIGKEILAYKKDAASALHQAEIFPILNSIGEISASGQISPLLERLDLWLRTNDPNALNSTSPPAPMVSKRRKPVADDAEGEPSSEGNSLSGSIKKNPKLTIGIAATAALIVLGLTIWLAYTLSTNNNRNTAKNNQTNVSDTKQNPKEKPAAKTKSEDAKDFKPDVDMGEFVAQLEGDENGFTPVKKEFKLDPNKNKKPENDKPAPPANDATPASSNTPKATTPLGSAPTGTTQDPMDRNTLGGNPTPQDAIATQKTATQKTATQTTPTPTTTSTDDAAPVKDESKPDDQPAATEAAEPENPSGEFDKFDEAVDLPLDLTNTQPVKLGTIELPKNYLLGVELVSGKPISRAKLTFELIRDTDDKQLWNVNFRRRPNDDPVTVASMNFVDNELKFQWSAAAAENEQANFLRNCLLKIKGKRKSTFLSLRKPVEISGLAITKDSTSVKVDAEIGWLPHPDFLKIEIQPIEDKEILDVLVEPQFIQKKNPGRVFFAREPSYRFGWIEIDAEARKDLSFEMDVKLLTSPTSKPKNARFKDLEMFASGMKASAERSRKLVESLKEARQPANMSRENFSAYKREVESTNTILQKQSVVAINLEKGITALLDKQIPLSVYFELNGVRVVIANSK